MKSLSATSAHTVPSAWALRQLAVAPPLSEGQRSLLSAAFKSAPALTSAEREAA
ncbi:hypothetical protein [Cryobacterium sp. SO1]|uniref:hypothetical protein n=1 Tax=Cryobacterium sp. SO1 TaxID=1897061 RepID=UPI0010E0282B|nr:hypothetical protein [Cryobacterium sp. SO1]RZI35302.1 hypothetical protein BJQ95_02369 [Cryobacterium sp. SO1]